MLDCKTQHLTVSQKGQEALGALEYLAIAHSNSRGMLKARMIPPCHACALFLGHFGRGSWREYHHPEHVRVEFAAVEDQDHACGDQHEEPGVNEPGHGGHAEVIDRKRTRLNSSH